MQRHRFDAVFCQEFGHVVGTELGTREHQHLTPVVFLDDVGQQGLFLAAANRVDHLGDTLHSGVARRDLYALRVLQQRSGEVTDFIAESGREQQALLVFGNRSQHFFDIMDEAHVEHAVGFVQHQHLHLAQVQHALLHQIKQATRGGHQNIHAFFDLGDLWVHAHATKNNGRGQFQVFTVGLHRLFHLGG